MASRPRTLYEKIFDAHLVEQRPDGTCLLYIDRHLVHEVTSPQAFEGLRAAGRTVRRPDLTLAVPDHNLPTTPRLGPDGALLPIADPQSAAQLDALERNAAQFGVRHIASTAPEQGIVHVVGPEQGFSLPGATIVCGDSHTSAHGGLGALAFGIGTSEVEHVLATQTLQLVRSKTMAVEVSGALGPGVTAKDLVLHIIGTVGTAGGTGHVIEFRGPVFAAMSVEARLTVCNMSIEAGARSGLIAPDDTVFDWLRGRPMAPSGAAWEPGGRLVARPRDRSGRRVRPHGADRRRRGRADRHLGHQPRGRRTDRRRGARPRRFASAAKREAAARSLDYMGLAPGTPLTEIAVENVFIGSCTNSRIEDFRAAAAVLRGRRKADGVRWAIAVPGSGLVKRQAEEEGLDTVFRDAGFEWREPGCSACLAMNPDKVPPGERCASTSNRNFVGRQGPGARTHLMSPAMAAAAAVEGRLADVRRLDTA